MKNKVIKWVVFSCLVFGILSLGVYAIKGSIVPRPIPEVDSYQPWDPELVEMVSEMPVQEGGRLKPFSSWAMYRLYSIHSKKKIKILVDGEKVVISPTEWMLDCIFRPEVADRLPSFRIEDSRVAEALAIKTGEFEDRKGRKVTKKRRDLYSYDEIENPNFVIKYDEQREKNLQLLGEGKVPKGIEGMKSNLIGNIGEYRKQVHFLDVARFFSNFVSLEELEENAGKKLSQKEAEAALESIIINSYLNLRRKIEEGNKDVIGMWEGQQFLELRMIPPSFKDNYTWVSYNTAIQEILLNDVDGNTDKGKAQLRDGIGNFAEWIRIAFAYDNFGEKALKEKLRDYNKSVGKILVERGEDTDLVKSEVKYYNRNYYAYAFGFFLLGCLVMIALLPSPQTIWGKLLGYLAFGCSSAGVLFVLTGVVHRAYIMERFPLGKLYDTILVITVVGVSVLLFMEILSRKKICLGVAVTMGLMGMFLANRFEVGDGNDTLAPLQAVLNSDYWLMTHVTSITFGYAGGLVAAFLSIFYLLSRMTGIDGGDKSYRRLMTRMAYGAACFTLIFSLVGTILGGVWANDSWGRFWGWDPKENGALMIVLWFLAVLHARLGGYIREWGLHICMVLGANIIAFSWWGVNFLNTGLHNYGFASGGDGEWWLNVYYILNTSIAVVAFGFAWYEWEAKRQKKKNRLAGDTSRSAEIPPPLPENEGTL